MAKKSTPFSLEGFTKLPDGTYIKTKTVDQPRDIAKGITPKELIHNYKLTGTSIESQIETINSKGDWRVNPQLRIITLTLFGIPMPKQSVRATKSGHFFQPQITVDRKKDYQRQIREQLPADFVMFETIAHLTKFHCIFPPLKAFHKIKGRMDAIRNGEIFYKTSKPDLIDNLKKLAFDSMSGIVTKDDSLIVTENDTAKYYGIGGCIIITLKGY